MTTQDWIAAAIAIFAFLWLLWRFGAMTGIRKPSSSPDSSDQSGSAGCAKCAVED